MKCTNMKRKRNKDRHKRCYKPKYLDRKSSFGVLYLLWDGVAEAS